MAAAAAAAVVTQAMSKTTNSYNSYALYRLAKSLSALATRLEPKEAARVSAAAAATISQAMSKMYYDRRDLPNLAEALGAVAGHLEPKPAAEAAATLIQGTSKTTDFFERRDLERVLWALAARLEAQEAAAMLLQARAKTTVTYYSGGLWAGLNRESTARHQQRILSVTGSVGLGTSPISLPLLLPILGPALAPLPEPLPPETLVELLKHPLCVGEARRIVLDALGTRYQRPFADQWDFVRFAQQQNLGLDLTSPPKRR
jgi:hypothetical protein